MSPISPWSAIVATGQLLSIIDLGGNQRYAKDHVMETYYRLPAAIKSIGSAVGRAVHGTFTTAAKELDRVAAMGFEGVVGKREDGRYEKMRDAITERDAARRCVLDDHACGALAVTPRGNRLQGGIDVERVVLIGVGEIIRRRKRGGALASKHRFIAAQMEAYLAGDLWIHPHTLGRIASRLAARPLDPDVDVVCPDVGDVGRGVEGHERRLAMARRRRTAGSAQRGNARRPAGERSMLPAEVKLADEAGFDHVWDFDHLAAITNFVIMPMTFLSGTFYLIEKFGLSVQSAQVHLFVFLFASALGTLVGGPLGDVGGEQRARFHHLGAEFLDRPLLQRLGAALGNDEGALPVVAAVDRHDEMAGRDPRQRLEMIGTGGFRRER